MPGTMTLRDGLLPELAIEIGKTRRLFEALPNREIDFKPHEKSMTLGRLASHIADLYRIIELSLTSPDLDWAMWNAFTMENKVHLLAQFEVNAGIALTTLEHAQEEDFSRNWRIFRGADTLFDGKRYAAYRSNGMNQIIHHRAQLGSYIRALDLPLPGMYGPSADGI
jgi:uncharacterized damage-inducible protein DinB